MKLTEAKLKQMIKEMMDGRLVHNGKPPLSENGKKIEELLLSQEGDFIIQAQTLLDAISSTLDPLEADYLDLLSKAAAASLELKQIEKEKEERLKIADVSKRPPLDSFYPRRKAANKDFLDAYYRLVGIIGQDEATVILRNFWDLVI